MLHNYLVKIGYNGNNFHGWQKQKNTKTIQGEIEYNISKILNENVSVVGCGRTDAYVHAIVYYFNFKTTRLIKNKQFINSLNKLLTPHITFYNVKKVKDDFNACSSVINKTYEYKIYLGKHVHFQHDHALHYTKKINIDLMKKASLEFIGEKNFLSFSNSIISNTIRTVNYIKFRKTKDYLYIEVNGNGFLRSMVRMIVGTLLDINEEKKTINDIKNLFLHPKKGSCVTKVKGCGLYLKKINYNKK